MSVHFSSNSNEWATPQDLYNKLDSRFHFTLDPCCTKTSAKCKKFFTIKDDGLSKDWSNERVFLNPPYSRGQQEKWIEKAYLESLKGALVVCLIPARTEVKFFYDYCTKASEIIFIVGRIKFVRENIKIACAPFPSCLVIFDGNDKSLLKVSWKKQIDL